VVKPPAPSYGDDYNPYDNGGSSSSSSGGGHGGYGGDGADNHWSQSPSSAAVAAAAMGAPPPRNSSSNSSGGCGGARGGGSLARVLQRRGGGGAAAQPVASSRLGSGAAVNGVASKVSPFATEKTAAQVEREFHDADKVLTQLMTEKSSLANESERLLIRGLKTLKDRTRLQQVDLRLDELGKEISTMRKVLSAKPQ
jgi:hypothetical protein